MEKETRMKEGIEIVGISDCQCLGFFYMRATSTWGGPPHLLSAETGLDTQKPTYLTWD